jgi:hypothetical protein
LFQWAQLEAKNDADKSDAARSKKDAGKPDAGFLGSGKASDDRREGVYIGYMTEWREEAGAARSKKDASGAGMAFFICLPQPLIG